MVVIMMSNPVDPLSNSDSQKVPICAESVSSAVIKYQHLQCDCEWKSRNSEGVFRQLYAEAWPRDHGWGHDVEMAGDECLRWQAESKDEV